MLVSAQTMPHDIAPPGHMHTPATQFAPAAHVWLQTPQCRVLVCVSTQRGAAPGAVQSVRPLVPQLEHVPPPHVPSAPQLLRQVPQFVGSVRVSTHWPPHAVSPAGQLQTPATHVVAPAHCVWHVPQFMGSV